MINYLNQGLYLLGPNPYASGQSLWPQGWQIGQRQVTVPRGEQAQIDRFRELLVQAVSKKLSAPDKLGLELSGGLDSSSVAASLRGAFPDRPISAFTHVLPPHYQPQSHAEDESSYSRKVSKHLSLHHTCIHAGFHFADTLDLYADILGGFSEVLYPILAHRIFEEAQAQGITVLFSGFGGDEAVTHQATQYLNELRTQRRYFKLMREVGFRRCLKSRINKVFNRPKIFTERWIDDLSELIKAPYQHLMKAPHDPRFGTYPSVRAVAYEVLHGRYSGHLHARVNTSRKIAAHYGIDMRFPLLDPDLLDYWYHLPSHLLRRNGQGRWLMRQAMKGHLPEPVRLRQDKTAATCAAASLAFDQALPTIFLARISPSYAGTISEYVDIPSLIKRVEAPGEKSSTLKRLCVCVLMLDRLERKNTTTL